MIIVLQFDRIPDAILDTGNVQKIKFSNVHEFSDFTNRIFSSLVRNQVAVNGAIKRYGYLWAGSSRILGAKDRQQLVVKNSNSRKVGPKNVLSGKVSQQKQRLI